MKRNFTTHWLVSCDHRSRKTLETAIGDAIATFSNTTPAVNQDFVWKSWDYLSQGLILEKLKCQTCLFQLYFAAACFKTFNRKQRDNELVPATLSHIGNTLIQNVWKAENKRSKLTNFDYLDLMNWKSESKIRPQVVEIIYLPLINRQKNYGGQKFGIW